jgi:hypothetical protein
MVRPGRGVGALQLGRLAGREGGTTLMGLPPDVKDARRYRAG